MRIIDITTEYRRIPLKNEFRTALRTAVGIDVLTVRIKTEELDGTGEATPVFEITGETIGSVTGAVERIKPFLLSMDIDDSEDIFRMINRYPGNPSAKAALDMAVYDIICRRLKLPLYKYLGGSRCELTTDMTISANNLDLMMNDCRRRIEEGFTHLKVKVGTDAENDLNKLLTIAKAFGSVRLRIDANQGWTPKEAVRIMTNLEDALVNIELLEQPVEAHDLSGLKYVTDNISTPVMADESVFSPRDAIKILEVRAADIINIKLMKTGGINNALKICAIAEEYCVECMMGCMLEGITGISAAAHLAIAKKVITKIDLDAVVLSGDSSESVKHDMSKITVSDGYGISLIGGS